MQRLWLVLYTVYIFQATEENTTNGDGKTASFSKISLVTAIICIGKGQIQD